ncbi:hypothetical protein HDV05_005558 [Chytridiales sp. JEL 0842]|nr:hypothetical protein HDV05_005558 [Chytridiales sp. JEL 0842]
MKVAQPRYVAAPSQFNISTLEAIVLSEASKLASNLATHTLFLIHLPPNTAIPSMSPKSISTIGTPLQTLNNHIYCAPLLSTSTSTPESRFIDAIKILGSFSVNPDGPSDPGWYDFGTGSIMDICDGQIGVPTGLESIGYQFPFWYSLKANGCVLNIGSTAAPQTSTSGTTETGATTAFRTTTTLKITSTAAATSTIPPSTSRTTTTTRVVTTQNPAPAPTPGVRYHCGDVATDQLIVPVYFSTDKRDSLYVELDYLAQSGFIQAAWDEYNITPQPFTLKVSQPVYISQVGSFLSDSALQDAVMTEALKITQPSLKTYTLFLIHLPANTSIPNPIKTQSLTCANGCTYHNSISTVGTAVKTLNDKIYYAALTSNSSMASEERFITVMKLLAGFTLSPDATGWFDDFRGNVVEREAGDDEQDNNGPGYANHFSHADNYSPCIDASDNAHIFHYKFSDDIVKNFRLYYFIEVFNLITDNIHHTSDDHNAFENKNNLANNNDIKVLNLITDNIHHTSDDHNAFENKYYITEVYHKLPNYHLGFQQFN